MGKPVQLLRPREQGPSPPLLPGVWQAARPTSHGRRPLLLPLPFASSQAALQAQPLASATLPAPACTKLLAAGGRRRRPGSVAQAHRHVLIALPVCIGEAAGTNEWRAGRNVRGSSENGRWTHRSPRYSGPPTSGAWPDGCTGVEDGESWVTRRRGGSDRPPGVVRARSPGDEATSAGDADPQLLLRPIRLEREGSELARGLVHGGHGSHGCYYAETREANKLSGPRAKRGRRRTQRMHARLVAAAAQRPQRPHCMRDVPPPSPLCSLPLQERTATRAEHTWGRAWLAGSNRRRRLTACRP